MLAILVILREPFALCHSEGALRLCHPEGTEGPKDLAQDKLRDRRIQLLAREILRFAQNDIQFDAFWSLAFRALNLFGIWIL